MSIQRYQEYKKSGIEWLGDTPSTWTIKRLGYFFDERRERVSDKDFQPLSVTKHGIVPQLETAAKSDDGDNRKKVCSGDFVINSRSDRKGSSGASPLNGSVSLINTVIVPKKNIDIKFAHYLFRSTSFQEEYYRYGKGIVADLWSTNYSEMKNISIPVPSLIEQNQIAVFLDEETTKIDTLVAEQAKLIELLKEKRQAVISQAVTKGLNSNVKMKDSLVAWLGEVPDHWDVVPLKYLFHMKSGEQITSEQIRDEGDFPVYGGNGLRGYFEKYTHDGEYPLIGRQGALCGNINYANGKFWASEHAVVVIPHKKTNIFYIGELLRSMNLGQYSTSAAQPGLSVEAIGNLRIPAPAIEEQNQIADYLIIEARKWESLIEAATQSISLFQERRSALISAAVTGQIDVRNYQPKEVA
jgi:type I restriction enzyme S subunit